MVLNQIILGLLILVAVAGYGLNHWMLPQPSLATRAVWLTVLGGASASIVALLAVMPWPRRWLPLLVWLDIVALPVLLGQTLLSWAVVLLHHLRAPAFGAERLLPGDVALVYGICVGVDRLVSREPGSVMSEVSVYASPVCVV